MKPHDVIGVVAAALAIGTASGQSFDVTLDLDLSGLSPSDEIAAAAAFTDAEAAWESFISAYRPDVAAALGSFNGPTIEGTIEFIDGPGNILGSAGPTSAEFASDRVVSTAGRMRFDSADVASLIAGGSFEAVILHEMAHVLGIGTLWEFNGLSTCNDTGSPTYSGAGGLAGAQSDFGVFTPDIIELDGGGGTRCGHWDENIFDNELMTGFLNGGRPNPISNMTLGSFEDMGFEVNLIGAEPCNLADIAAPFGVLDLADVDAFIVAFLAGGSDADIAAPFGVLDLGDIDTFIASFLAGCPAPAPGRQGVVGRGFQCRMTFGVLNPVPQAEIRFTPAE